MQKFSPNIPCCGGGMVDTLALGASGSNPMRVRVSPTAQKSTKTPRQLVRSFHLKLGAIVSSKVFSRKYRSLWKQSVEDIDREKKQEHGENNTQEKHN